MEGLTEEQSKIIYNNYSIFSNFDDVSEGRYKNSSKFLDKDSAHERKRNLPKGYLTSYSVIKELAIVGIVPFNSSVGYIFNQELPYSELTDKESITCGNYEDLMKCYVFMNGRISKNKLERLIKEYYDRGGKLYDKYHSFEEEILNVVRNFRNKNYIDEIVFDSIFKHGFREIKKLTWSNGKVKIKRKMIQRGSISYPSDLQHTELDTTLENKILIGSIFGKTYNHINQLNTNKFGIICKNVQNSRYNFAYFEIEF